MCTLYLDILYLYHYIILILYYKYSITGHLSTVISISIVIRNSGITCTLCIKWPKLPKGYNISIFVLNYCSTLIMLLMYLIILVSCKCTVLYCTKATRIIIVLYLYCTFAQNNYCTVLYLYYSSLIMVQYTNSRYKQAIFKKRPFCYQRVGLELFGL